MADATITLDLDVNTEEAEGKFKSLRTEIKETKIELQKAQEAGDNVRFNKLKNDLDELEDTGGLEGFMNEGKRSLKEAKSNIKTTWRNVQDLEADMQDWMSTLDAQQVQDVLDTLQNFVDNYEGGMDMDDDF